MLNPKITNILNMHTIWILVFPNTIFVILNNTNNEPNTVAFMLINLDFILFAIYFKKM